MDGSTFQLIQTLCEQFYNPRSPEQRYQAEVALLKAFPTFSEADQAPQLPPGSTPASPTIVIPLSSRSPAETFVNGRKLLENSPSPYVHMFATARIRALVLAQFGIFTLEQKLELRNFIFNYIGQHPDLQPFVLNSLCQLFCIVTKLGWFDNEAFQNVAEDIQEYLKASVLHRIIALQLLGCVVTEMRLAYPGGSVSRQRRIAVNFRDNQLMDIFPMALQTMRELVSSNSSEIGNKMKDACLGLIKSCLVFDFIGTAPDDEVDDTYSIQVPSRWRSYFEDRETISMFFQCSTMFPSPYNIQTMECIALIASVRRSLFNDERRSEFITAIMEESGFTLSNGAASFNDPDYAHEFCRMLARFRNTFHTYEIVDNKAFPQWISLVANFTMTAFRTWEWSRSTIEYLLTFWAKMMSSINNSKPSHNQFETLAAEVANSFVQSRMELVDLLASNSTIENPLDDQDVLVCSLDLLSSFARWKYENMSEFLSSKFPELMTSFEESLKSSATIGFTESTKTQLLSIQEKFSWIVYIIGSLISGRKPYQSTEEQDTIDGEMTCEVIQLMKMNEQWVAQYGNPARYEKLDHAILFFFDQFRKNSVGEQAQRATNIYTKLDSMFGITDQTKMMEFILTKIGNCLKFWPENEKIVHSAIKLLHDLSIGYGTLKMLISMDTIKFIIENHTSTHFPFLDYPINLRNRTLYYASLARILFSVEDYEVMFDRFIQPFTLTIQQLNALDTMESFQQQRIQQVLLGLFRDLRGIVSGCSNKGAFNCFFEWFFPNCEFVFRVIEARPSDYNLINGLMKFWHEFVQNKYNRLNFDKSSCNGILMFRETSRLLCGYANAFRKIGISKSPNIYKEMYKNITNCLNIFASALKGNYVTFGVFELYDDPSLFNAFQSIFLFCLTIPLSEMLSYPKFRRSLYGFLDSFCQEQLYSMNEISKESLDFIVQALNEGLRCRETAIQSQTCGIIDVIATFVFEKSKRSGYQHHLIDYLKSNPTIISYFMESIFYVLLFEDDSIQWSFSRPLLCLILLDKEGFKRYSEKLVECQLTERQETLSKAMEKLVEDLEPNVGIRNRDRFTQQVSAFLRELHGNGITLTLPAKSFQMS